MMMVFSLLLPEALCPFSTTLRALVYSIGFFLFVFLGSMNSSGTLLVMYLYLEVLIVVNSSMTGGYNVAYKGFRLGLGLVRTDSDFFISGARTMWFEGIRARSGSSTFTEVVVVVAPCGTLLVVLVLLISCPMFLETMSAFFIALFEKSSKRRE
jgi:hypothetical protein